MSKSINFLLTLFLLLTFNNVVTQCSEVDEFDELLALDDELEREKEHDGVKSSEAEVLTKAQRIVHELNNENTERIINGYEFVLVLVMHLGVQEVLNLCLILLKLLIL